MSAERKGRADGSGVSSAALSSRDSTPKSELEYVAPGASEGRAAPAQSVANTPATTALPEWVRRNEAMAYEVLLATLEVLLVQIAALDAKKARIQSALLLNDASLLRDGDVTTHV